jgi:hypothetical protein
LFKFCNDSGLQECSNKNNNTIIYRILYLDGDDIA